MEISAEPLLNASSATNMEEALSLDTTIVSLLVEVGLGNLTSVGLPNCLMYFD